MKMIFVIQRVWEIVGLGPAGLMGGGDCEVSVRTRLL